jgi:hypothetical protein
MAKSPGARPSAVVRDELEAAAGNEELSALHKELSAAENALLGEVSNTHCYYLFTRPIYYILADGSTNCS